MTRVAPPPAASTAPPLSALTHAQPTKRPWHASVDTVARRTVLLHILLLLKTKYGKVDSTIAYIARRAELALYSQAFSAREYRDPQTLSRRLHALVVKLHMQNLAAREDAVVAAEDAALQALGMDDAAPSPQLPPAAASSPRTRLRCSSPTTDSLPAKRQRIHATAATVRPPSLPCRLFFDGTMDLLQHVTTFLDARDVVRCSMASRSASRALPGFVTRLELAVDALAALAPVHRRQFFRKFPSLRALTLRGGGASQYRPLQLDAQYEGAFIAQNAVVRSLLTALSHSHVRKLERVRLECAFLDGLGDRIACQVACVVLASSARFPLLQELALCGNGISDDGAASLHAALVTRVASDARATHARLRLLNVEHNFIGERGVEQLADAVAAYDGALEIRMQGNLVGDSSRREHARHECGERIDRIEMLRALLCRRQQQQ